jgi:hypothetical protein
MNKKKYVSVNNTQGKSYSDVAKIMTESGHKMNHSSVRNHITRGFMKIVKNISKEYDLKYNDDKIKEIAQSEELQSSIVNIMKRG